jgi:hypothetical protein
MSYHIEINEYQRRLIMKALSSTDVNQFSQAPGSGDAFDTEAKEFVCLVQMFGTRPGGLKLFSASKCDPARLRSNVSWWRPDCLAGHVRFELRNVVANYAFEKSGDLRETSRILATETIRV